MNKRVVVALQRALDFWCAQPGAFTAARNGGAEAILRNAFQGELEVEFSCLGFAEAGGKRVDCTLVVSEVGPVCFEFKHGMLHHQQIASIFNEYSKAKAQLINKFAVSRYYVHFIHALECDDPNVGFAKEHNSKVSTHYKKFQSQEKLEKLLEIITEKLGAVWLKMPIQQNRFAGVRATLYCWAYSVNEAGHEEQLLSV